MACIIPNALHRSQCIAWQQQCHIHNSMALLVRFCPIASYAGCVYWFSLWLLAEQSGRPNYACVYSAVSNFNGNLPLRKHPYPNNGTIPILCLREIRATLPASHTCTQQFYRLGITQQWQWVGYSTTIHILHTTSNTFRMQSSRDRADRIEWNGLYALCGTNTCTHGIRRKQLVSNNKRNLIYYIRVPCYACMYAGIVMQ